MKLVDAQKIKESVKKKATNLAGQVGGSTTKIPPHKHCRVCFTPIDLKAEPRVCKDQSCIDKNLQDEKNQKRVQTWMFIFFGLFVVAFIGPILL